MEFGFCGSRVLEVQSQYPSSLDQKRAVVRKRVEPEIVQALHSVQRIRENRPRAQAALKKATHELKAVLSRWESAYNKENFYRGIRILLELQRNGSSKR